MEGLGPYLGCLGESWTRQLDKATGQGNWTRQLDKATGQDNWTRQLDKTTGQDNWTKQLDKTTGQDDWTRQLDKTTGQDNRIGVTKGRAWQGTARIFSSYSIVLHCKELNVKVAFI